MTFKILMTLLLASSLAAGQTAPCSCGNDTRPMLQSSFCRADHFVIVGTLLHRAAGTNGKFMYLLSSDTKIYQGTYFNTVLDDERCPMESLGNYVGTRVILTGLFNKKNGTAIAHRCRSFVEKSSLIPKDILSLLDGLQSCSEVRASGGSALNTFSLSIFTVTIATIHFNQS
ncbi:uncharacterized protein LOC141905692 isoform X2 [Tubulanus polymorphus]